VIYIERVARSGAAATVLGASGNPFPATLGLRLDRARRDPAPATRWCRAPAAGGSPTAWVPLAECGYVSLSTTAAHFRKLTSLVLLAALDQAGEGVAEPSFAGYRPLRAQSCRGRNSPVRHAPGR
jgi:hypothetical protein